MKMMESDGAVLEQLKAELGPLIEVTNDLKARTDGATAKMGADVERMAADMARVSQDSAKAMEIAGKAAQAAKGALERAEAYDNLETAMRDGYAKLEQRMEELAAIAQRPGRGDATRPEGFGDFIAENHDKIREVMESSDRNARFRAEDVPRIDMRTLPNLGTTELGDMVQNRRLPMFELLRNPMVALLDVIPKMPAVRGKTIEAPYWLRKSKAGFVQTLVNGAITGDVSPVNDVTVDSTAGFFAGAYVRFYTAGSNTLLGRVKLASVPDSTSLIFATDAIDFAISDNDECYCEAIAATADEGSKPAGHFANELATVTSQVIATHVKLTRQMLADAPELSSYIQGELRERLRESLELHCLYGTGTAPLLNGFMNHGSLTTDSWSGLAVGDTMADLLGYSAGRIPSRFPKVCVMSIGTDFEETGTAYESDWNKMVRKKADDGHYVHSAMGPVRVIDEPGRKAIGAIRVLETQQIWPGSALMLDPRSASVLIPRAGMTRFEVGYDGNDMTQNLVTMLYEEGWAHLIKDVAAFRALSFDAEPSAI